MKKNRQNNIFLGTYYIKSLVLSKWHNFIGWMRRWRSWLKSSQCGIFQLRAFGKNWGICAVKKKLTAACQKARPSICIIHSNFLSVLYMSSINNFITLWIHISNLCSEEDNTKILDKSSQLEKCQIDCFSVIIIIYTFVQ